MIGLNKKAIIALLGIIACIIIFSEFSNGREKRSFLALTTTENATVEFSRTHDINHIPPLSILPQSLSEAELDEWVEQEGRLELLRLEGQAQNKASIPNLLIEQNPSLDSIEASGTFYPLEQTLAIPFDSFSLCLDPSRTFLKESSSTTSVLFHLSGFWILESQDGYSPLFLQGTIELDASSDHSFKQLMKDRNYLAYYTGVSPLNMRVEYESIYGSNASIKSFQNFFIASENESYHFLLETYLIENVDHRVLLPTGSQMIIRFLPSDQAEHQISNPVFIRIKQAPGLGFNLNTTLQLSPMHRLRFEQALQYEDFFLFVATLDDSKHNVLDSANFLWSDGKQTYIAYQLFYPLQDKVLFITDKNPHLNNTNQISIEHFEATFLHAQQVKIPVQELTKETLISYLGKSITVTEVIEDDTGAIPKIRVLLQEQEVLPFQGNFRVEYGYSSLFHIIRASKKAKNDDAVIYYSNVDVRKKTNPQEEILLSFERAEPYLSNIEWLPDITEPMDFDQYTYDLYLPMFQTKIKLASKSIAMPIKKTNTYYAPR